MDFDENKAFLQQFRRGNTAQAIQDSDDDSDSSLTQPPTPLPPPPPPASSHPPQPPVLNRPSTPNSSAPTVSPPHSPPPSPPQRRPPPSPPRTPAPRAPRHRASSPASSASTVPPPSPGALNRVNNRTTPRAVTVRVHEGGIESLPHPSPSPDSSYPRLRHARFTHAGQPSDLYLSTLNAARPFAVLPARIASFLSPFQRDGVTFLYRLYERRRGGLLADSMGLGKTVQTICFLGAAFAVWDRREESDFKAPRILVVAPISVKENWKREFETWTPFRCMLYNRNAEPDICRGLRNGAFDVLITGDNPVAAHGKEFFSDPLGDGKWRWDVVIMDEIHVAKNRNTKIFKSLSALPKEVMFGLTGTAVQNRLNELWNVMSLVVPETLWPSYKSFKADYTDVINKGTKKDASEYMRRKARERIAKLRKLLSKHMVRRPKSVIEAQLPGKTDYCVLMRMKRDGLQGYMYHRFQSSYDVKMLRDALLPCDCGSQANSKECCHRFPSTEENLSNAPIWTMVHNDGPCEKCPNCIGLHVQHFSRWLSAHVMLVLPGATETDQEKALARKKVFLYYLGDRVGIINEPVYSLERDNVLSCKLTVALKLLKTYESNGNKTIIFYESLRLGEILRRWAERNHLNFVVIDGSITNGKRQGAVDRFNTEKDISTFFISKKAGATGLNIFGADRVLIFEPCWNPTLDLQAGDRAYRLGQKRVVHIIRLVVENTIEHYVFKTALSKSQISSAILDNTREEWRVRENEIGSIRAMLSMGDVFEGHDGRPDDFKVMEAEDLIKENQEGNHSPADCAIRDYSREESDSLRGDYSPGVDDIIGEDGVCLLDVDVEEEEIQVNSSGDDEIEAEKDFIPSESQFETDQLFGEGACKKLVMHSTSARKRKGQMMGVSESRRFSGINPDGAVNVNLDAADLADLSMSMGTQEEDERDHWRDGVEERPTSRTVSNYRPSSGRERQKMKEAEFQEDSGDEVIVRKRLRPKITTQTESFISARRNKLPRRRPLEELLRLKSEDSKGRFGSKKGSTQKDLPHRAGEEPRQVGPSQAQPNKGRRKQEIHRKAISKTKQSNKKSNQTKQAPASAFAARARVRR